MRLIFWRVSVLILPLAFIALDAVPIETSAARATSVMVGAFDRLSVSFLAAMLFHGSAQKTGHIIFLQEDINQGTG